MILLYEWEGAVKSRCMCLMLLSRGAQSQHNINDKGYTPRFLCTVFVFSCASEVAIMNFNMQAVVDESIGWPDPLEGMVLLPVYKQKTWHSGFGSQMIFPTISFGKIIQALCPKWSPCHFGVYGIRWCTVHFWTNNTMCCSRSTGAKSPWLGPVAAGTMWMGHWTCPRSGRKSRNFEWIDI